MTLRMSSGSSPAKSSNCNRKIAYFLATSNSELPVFVVTTRYYIDYLDSQGCSDDVPLLTGRRHISSTHFAILDEALVGNVRNDSSSMFFHFACYVWVVDINLDFQHAHR